MHPHLCSKLLTRAVQETVHQIHKHPSPTLWVSSFPQGSPQKNQEKKKSRKHTSRDKENSLPKTHKIKKNSQQHPFYRHKKNPPRYRITGCGLAGESERAREGEIDSV